MNFILHWIKTKNLLKNITRLSTECCANDNANVSVRERERENEKSRPMNLPSSTRSHTRMYCWIDDIRHSIRHAYTLPKRKDELARALSLLRKCCFVSRFIYARSIARRPPSLPCKCRQFTIFNILVYSYIYIYIWNRFGFYFQLSARTKCRSTYNIIQHQQQQQRPQSKCSNVAFVPPFSLYFIADFKFNRIEFFLGFSFAFLARTNLAQFSQVIRRGVFFVVVFFSFFCFWCMCVYIFRKSKQKKISFGNCFKWMKEECLAATTSYF